MEPLKDYQRHAGDHLRDNRYALLKAKPGTGKTRTALYAALENPNKPKSVLIVCTKNALYTWVKEVAKWYPEYITYITSDSYSLTYGDNRTVVEGTPKQRAVLWTQPTLFKICTYGVLQQDKANILKQNWSVVIADECHRGGLRNKKTKGFKVFKDLFKRCSAMYLLTATPIRKGPQDLWSYLNILNHTTFSGYWKFVYAYCIVTDNGYGKEIVGPKNPEGLAALTARNYYAVPDKIADEFLPPLQRIFVPIKMEPKQRKMYDFFVEHLFIECEDGVDIVVAPTQMSAIIKLRKMLISPKLVDPGYPTVGPGLETIIDMLEDRENLHTVIFTPFLSAIDLMHRHLSEKYQTTHIYVLKGGMELEQIKAVVAAWKKNKGLMLCSLLFAQSFELDTTDACYFLGYDWDQNNNEQAEGRVRRLTNPTPINAYYIKHMDSVDEDILEVLNGNTHNVFTVNQALQLIRQKQLENPFG